MSVLAALAALGLGLALLQLGLVEARLQLLERRGAVLVLRTLVLAGDDDPGRDMRDAHRAVGRVDVLAARSRGPVGIDPQIGFIDVDLDVVVDLGIDPDARKARVPACIRHRTG